MQNIADLMCFNYLESFWWGGIFGLIWKGGRHHIAKLICFNYLRSFWTELKFWIVLEGRKAKYSIINMS